MSWIVEKSFFKVLFWFEIISEITEKNFTSFATSNKSKYFFLHSILSVLFFTIISEVFNTFFRPTDIKRLKTSCFFKFSNILNFFEAKMRKEESKNLIHWLRYKFNKSIVLPTFSCQILKINVTFVHISSFVPTYWNYWCVNSFLLLQEGKLGNCNRFHYR